MSERVMLFQLDGKLPNHALMRVSAHHRQLGDDVELRHVGNVTAIERELWDQPGRVYASLIFERTRPLAERLLEIYPAAMVGGTGWSLDVTLESIGVQTEDVDYGLYPRFRPSIGFSQRGCRLRCPFCVVPKKEGSMRASMTIDDIWRGNGHPREIVLLDNDFFGQPAWRDRIDELRDGGFRVNFTQGINARFLTSDAAVAIASVDYRDGRMKAKRIYTAWDNLKDEQRLFAGLQHLVDAGVKPDSIMVYMLVGYWPGETHEDRDHRRARLRSFGARPYPMPYVRTRELVAFQRWVVGAYDKRVSWDRWWSARGDPRRLGAQNSSQLIFPEAL